MLMDLTHNMAPEALSESHDQAELSRPSFTAGFQVVSERSREERRREKGEGEMEAGRVAWGKHNDVQEKIAHCLAIRDRTKPYRETKNQKSTVRPLV